MAVCALNLLIIIYIVLIEEGEDLEAWREVDEVDEIYVYKVYLPRT